MSWIDDITEKVVRRVPDLGHEDNEFLCEDLINEAFVAIVNYSKADSYKKEWDSTLIRCVAALYNNIGTEGLRGRSSLSTRDSFDNVDVIAPIIVSNVKQYIKPVGHVYKDTRFNFPE